MENKPKQQRSLISFPSMPHFRAPSLSQFSSFFPNLLEDFADSLGQFREQSGLTMYEDDRNLYVEAELPGLKADNIDVKLEQGILIINGQKDEEQEGKTYYCKAKSSRSYRIALPNLVNEENPDATFNNGILKLTFKKTKQAISRKINIKTESGNRERESGNKQKSRMDS